MNDQIQSITQPFFFFKELEGALTTRALERMWALIQTQCMPKVIKGCHSRVPTQLIDLKARSSFSANLGNIAMVTRVLSTHYLWNVENDYWRCFNLKPFWELIPCQRGFSNFYHVTNILKFVVTLQCLDSIMKSWQVSTTLDIKSPYEKGSLHFDPGIRPPGSRLLWL